MRNFNVAELAGGVALAAFGAWLSIQSLQYTMGTPSDMGPGFFPFAVGLMIIPCAIPMLIAGFRPGTAEREFDLRAFIAVTIALTVFVIAVRPLGLIPAVIAMTLTIGVANPGFRWRMTILTSLALSILAWLIFVVGLNMTIPAFGWSV
jgi:uncharacterized membrane protein